MKPVPTVLLESFRAGEFDRSFRFDSPERIITAATQAEVIPALQEVEAAVEAGFHAAGFICYEAAPALNPDLPESRTSCLPLVWFGIFRERVEVAAGTAGGSVSECVLSPLTSSVCRDEHRAAVSAIRDYIEAGHTYQVNYTFRQRFRFGGDPFALYRRVCRNQQSAFSAWIDAGRYRIISASPELFFALRDGCVTMRPMKGTAQRSSVPGEDRAAREFLRESPKERAENLMIVDMVRNDLAVIAVPGTVSVSSLFTVETYPTVHQMTSTVTAQIDQGRSLIDIFRALFPCGSVTGAPKRRTMEIIADLEHEPRGGYCGAVGFISPGREAVFSVGIRTAVLDSPAGTGELGVGSGITWDSEAAAEYEECFTKGAFLIEQHGMFNLLESILWEDGDYFLLDRHLKRLACSARFFGFLYDEESIRGRLASAASEITGASKVRLILNPCGGFAVEALPLPQQSSTDPAPITVASYRVNSRDPFLYHKTSRRERYEEERLLRPDCADVIFLNERGEVTEGSYTNVVVRLNGRLVTPPVSSGLLPGIFREVLLEGGIISEQSITLEDLRAADGIKLINSVRGWRKVYLTE